jgi:hypothetical protein
MDTFFFHVLPINAPHPNVSGTPLRSEKSYFFHVNAAGRSTQCVVIFLASDVRSVLTGWELNNPRLARNIRQDLRPCTSGGPAQVKECIKRIRVFCQKKLSALIRQFIQRQRSLFFLHDDFRPIGQCTHARASNECQPVQVSKRRGITAVSPNQAIDQ